MKTTINRSDLYHFERLVSKLVKPSELPVNVMFASCSDGLMIAAFCHDAVLTFTVPSKEIVDPFTLPWSLVKEFSAKKSDSIEVDINGNNVTLSWDASGIPQRKILESVGIGNNRLPLVPESTASHPMTIFDALVDASKCVDSDNAGYSLASICLRGGKSQIISTDGRQALIQDGFSFPFNDDVLCPVSKIFGSKELREIDDTVRIGVDGDFMYFNVGNVNFWLRKVEGKFPQMDQFTRNIDGHTWLHIDPTDAAFVTEKLDALPGKDNNHDPIFLALCGDVSVRGYDTVNRSATQLRLSKSRYEGSDVVMPVNRKFLKTALGFGITRIGFDPKGRNPLIGYGDRKIFVVMPLENEEPNVDSDKITILASESAPPKTADRRRQTAANSPAGRRLPTAATKKSSSKVAVLDEAVKLRQTLRETLTGVNGLIRSIKSQRRQDKLLRDTVASLRKLQNV